MEMYLEQIGDSGGTTYESVYRIYEGFEVNCIFDTIEAEVEARNCLTATASRSPGGTVLVPLRVTKAYVDSKSIKDISAVSTSSTSDYDQSIYGLVLRRHNGHTYRRLEFFMNSDSSRLLILWVAAKEERITLV